MAMFMGLVPGPQEGGGDEKLGKYLSAQHDCDICRGPSQVVLCH